MIGLAHAVLNAFVEAGSNFIDTADLYSVWGEGHEGGESEKISVNGSPLATTATRSSSRPKLGGLPTRPGLSADNVEATLDESLKRLQTDYVDPYYAHYDDENVAIIGQLKHANSLVESGKVKHIALSNFDPARMLEWFETAKAKGPTLPVAIQPHYNLIHRADFENAYKAIVDEFDVAAFPYFALASGLLTGKYRSKEDIQGKARQGFAEDLITDDALKVVEAVVEIAEARGVEPATVQLAWLLADGKAVTAPAASASTSDQLPTLMADR
ncbi:aldo/keto reductase [Enteractinococcus helveticum]|uniref:NADP-dependent oxidoreductase domain-containing protein n=1 Tax=Enteractinococcus helveticum TaxID=1837282 RepID=A0A1B7M160_9MICC|nr:aldo/keto reductase [Enteractinococcus helveticum]OAV62160.1 hypothetical protein A6F49_07665 [Enteractinococcus helveticum]